MSRALLFSFFFFFNDTATTEIYTLPLHDALPISCFSSTANRRFDSKSLGFCSNSFSNAARAAFEKELLRSEEHTSELQSHLNLVCRLLLEKKKQNCIELS